MDPSDRKHLALVGMEPAFQLLLETILAHEGYRVRAVLATSPEDIAGTLPDVILLGARSELDTLAWLDALRERTETAVIPVVVLGPSPELEPRAQASGNVVTVVPLPFDLDDLLDALKSALATTV
jgi:CheY-like chemotaxis protein